MGYTLRDFGTSDRDEQAETLSKGLCFNRTSGNQRGVWVSPKLDQLRSSSAGVADREVSDDEVSVRFDSEIATRVAPDRVNMIRKIPGWIGLNVDEF
jgi:hypothetical protein